MVNNKVPLTLSLIAIAKTDPKMGPIQGLHPKANAIPINKGKNEEHGDSLAKLKLKLLALAEISKHLVSFNIPIKILHSQDIKDEPKEILKKPEVKENGLNGNANGCIDGLTKDTSNEKTTEDNLNTDKMVSLKLLP